MSTGLRPTFLIIGAAKSGTTSLFEYLRPHPGIHLSPVKEPRFFAYEGADPGSVPPGPVVTSWDRYLQLFAGASEDQARGEASVAYLHTAGVIDRVRDRLPDARFVAILRNPSEAVWSAYLMARRHGLRAPITELLDTEPREPVTDLPPGGGPDQLVRMRFYHRHLERWFDAVGSDRLLVVFHDDLVRDAAAVLLDVCRHLGVDPTIDLTADRRHNVGTDPRSVRLDSWIHRPGRRLARVKAGLRGVPGVRRARALAARWNGRPTPPLPADIRRRLIDIYGDDTVALEEQLGRDLSAWR